MEDVDELIREYGLEEDGEHVIIPFTDRNGRHKRIFLLKRKFFRLVDAQGNYSDYPLPEVIEATVKFPERLLSEVISLFHKEPEVQDLEISGNERESQER
jgi:hypothetical protein